MPAGTSGKNIDDTRRPFLAVGPRAVRTAVPTGRALKRTGAAGGNHRDRDCRRHRRGHRAVETDFGPVAIDGRQQNLPRTARFGLARPLDGIASSRALAAACVDGEATIDPFGIDGDDNRLTAVPFGDSRDQRGIQ